MQFHTLMLIFTNKTCAICSLFLVFVHPAQTKRFVFVEAVVQGNFAFILCATKKLAAPQKYFKKGDFWMGETILKMQGIEKYFSGVHALKGVNFELRAGEVHAEYVDW